MHGLYLLWWVGERGLSPAIVAAIMAAGDLALLGLEIPTGWFADRYGHRASLIVGSSIQVLGMLACWLGRGVPELIAATRSGLAPARRCFTGRASHFGVTRTDD